MSTSADASQASIIKGHFLCNGSRKRPRPADFVDKKLVSLETGNHQLWIDVWHSIEEKVQELQTEVNSKILGDVLEFVKNSHVGFSPEQDVRCAHPEIPAAALLAGVNLPDHGVLFSTLSDLLTQKVTQFVVSLASKDCPTLKAMVMKVMSALMSSHTVLGDEDLDGNSVNMKTVSPNFSVLAQWYQMKAKQSVAVPKLRISVSPTKKKKSAYSVLPCKADVKYTPIVIIITDFESFPSHVLQDFITICSNHLHELPVTLVVGVATSVQVVHRLLPHAVTSLLSIDKFLAPPSSSHLSHVLEQILLTTTMPFKLGHKVYTCLLDMFLFHEFSVLRYMQCLKFCILEHFRNCPAAILCHAELQQEQVLLSPAQLTAIKQLPSFQQFLKSKPNSGTKEDSQVLIWKCVDELRNFHQRFFPVLRCLHAFASRLPHHPLGKQVRQIYGWCISKDIFKSEEYEQTLKLLRNLSRDELLSALKSAMGSLEINAPEDFQEVLDELQTFVEQLENIEELQRKADEEREKNLAEKPQLPKKTNMYQLRKALQELELKKKKFSVYEAVRNRLIDCLDILFRKHLVNPQSLPLHEAFYFNDVTKVKQRLVSCPRVATQQVLSNPYLFLENEDLKLTDDEIPPTLPDLSIAYKLHIECGRLINLYDWLQAFAAIKEPENFYAKNLPVGIHASFIQSVSELQFLGFVKSTKRKTDHVSRLTWGAC